MLDPDSAATLSSPTIADRARRLLELKAELEAAEAETSRIKKEIERAEFELAAQMADEETQNVKLADGTTVYLAREFYCSKASGVDTQELVTVLDRLGLGDFASRSVNMAGLKSYLRKLDEEHQEQSPGASVADAAPAPLRDLLSIYEKTTVRTRRGK